MNQNEMIRGIDFVTIEVYGFLQSYDATIEECQRLIEANNNFASYDVKVLNHQKDTGYIDVALYPKNGNKRKFIKDIKEDGYID